ncbi:YggS family pyridoxal phosphate-dependent enzyme [Thalassotalea mangrovi]|uniref:Pyridoxal phosphate homeostasis protein n=1 Tax=Thalassotalea mangrovi TaxID=2572245 RepID=A0A4U1B908_9GAMM|nr:YggS family pyridoxal phosphate-dependent enzyme [Thalassotalea mangrovi]TKB47123.1 YggS family pyridoxal phosphate-dependent enzyme [Thalassotalea mangrovi]
MTEIATRLTQVRQQIIQACQQAKRAPQSVTLLAVSKTKSASLIQQAIDAGQRDFGENYVQEAVEKIQLLAHNTDLTWHFIGPIQTNKTRLIAENFSWVHSVDREKVAKRLNEQRDPNITPLNVCLQVNISDETSKSGVNPDELLALADFISNCNQLRLRGVMAIPEKTDNIETCLQQFNALQNLFKTLQQHYPDVDTLSMGMSGDMKQAITCGSTMVRIGTAIFGQRN